MIGAVFEDRTVEKRKATPGSPKVAAPCATRGGTGKTARLRNHMQSNVPPAGGCL